MEFLLGVKKYYRIKVQKRMLVVLLAEGGLQNEELGSLKKNKDQGALSKTDKEISAVKEDKGSDWSLVSPARVGRAQVNTPQRDEVGIQILASKYSVLATNEVEEGEIAELVMEEDEADEIEEADILEGDIMEDEILEQETKVKAKAGLQREVRKVQKTKAQEALPKSKRSSRRKL